MKVKLKENNLWNDVHEYENIIEYYDTKTLASEYAKMLFWTAFDPNDDPTEKAADFKMDVQVMTDDGKIFDYSVEAYPDIVFEASKVMKI